MVWNFERLAIDLDRALRPHAFLVVGRKPELAAHRRIGSVCAVPFKTRSDIAACTARCVRENQRAAKATGDDVFVRRGRRAAVDALPDRLIPVLPHHSR